jgi:hypothetical protein
LRAAERHLASAEDREKKLSYLLKRQADIDYEEARKTAVEQGWPPLDGLATMRALVEEAARGRTDPRRPGANGGGALKARLRRVTRVSRRRASEPETALWIRNG